MSIRGRKVTTFVPDNTKVADITHADVNHHTITLATMGLPVTAVCLILGAMRQGGTGMFYAYPNEGGVGFYIGHVGGTSYAKSVGIINQRLEYNLTVANDDFDLYCFGYWIES